MNVQNELGVIVIFAQACEAEGWKINHIQAEFPDALIQDENGDTYRAEFEFCASNFKIHRHDLCQCDVIICWENDWDDCPLTVWSMQSWDDTTITIQDEKDLLIASLTLENKYLKRKVSRMMKDKKHVRPGGRRDLAHSILEKRPEITGAELGGILDCSASLARRFKREIQNNGNGHKTPALEVRE